MVIHVVHFYFRIDILQLTCNVLHAAIATSAQYEMRTGDDALCAFKWSSAALQEHHILVGTHGVFWTIGKYHVCLFCIFDFYSFFYY